MLHQVKLTLPFLEQRTYLHGTTLFEALTHRIPLWDSATLKIRQPLLTNTIAVRSSPDDMCESSATWAYTHKGKTCTVHVYPLEAQLPIHREVYDEAAIVTQAHFDADAVSFTAPWPYSFVKIIVALQKALLQRMMPEKIAGQWLFVGLELCTMPQPAPLHLRVVSNLGGGKLVSAQLRMAERTIGQLFFSHTKTRLEAICSPPLLPKTM